MGEEEEAGALVEVGMVAMGGTGTMEMNEKVEEGTGEIEVTQGKETGATEMTQGEETEEIGVIQEAEMGVLHQGEEDQEVTAETKPSWLSIYSCILYLPLENY